MWYNCSLVVRYFGRLIKSRSRPRVFELSPFDLSCRCCLCCFSLWIRTLEMKEIHLLFWFDGLSSTAASDEFWRGKAGKVCFYLNFWTWRENQRASIPPLVFGGVCFHLGLAFFFLSHHQDASCTPLDKLKVNGPKHLGSCMFLIFFSFGVDLVWTPLPLFCFIFILFIFICLFLLIFWFLTNFLINSWFYFLH